jgi:hypothetical protein
MKKSQKVSLLSLITVILAFSIFALETQAQCVQCTLESEGWVCTGTTSGGSGCVTKGANCTLIGICFSGSGRVGQESNCSSKALKALDHSLVNVPDSVIREIGHLNPQAALALISIRDIKLEFNVGKVSLFPIELTTEDVERHLTLPESSDYFKEQKMKVRKAFASKQEPIVYEFHLNKDEDANAFSLSLKAMRPIPSSSSFEINLSKVSEGSGENNSTRFDAISWQAN